jgi:hypothetical protein
VGGSCNYLTQPCCAQGGGGGVPCVANSTCSCDTTDYTVKCSELPVDFCPTQGNVKGKMNIKKQKTKMPQQNMKKGKVKGVVSG